MTDDDIEVRYDEFVKDVGKYLDLSSGTRFVVVIKDGKRYMALGNGKPGTPDKSIEEILAELPPHDPGQIDKSRMMSWFD